MAFASRALTYVEQNYSQIEKEMLAICFACSKFHQHIYGKCTDVQTDHRPVESILRKRIAKAVPPEIQSYWGIRDELHEADRLLLFGDRIIVPTILRSSQLQFIHEGHLGGEKCKLRARSSLFWPCMCQVIEETVAKCSICLKYRAANPKEPLIPHIIPGLRWEKVAVDIMTYQGHDYIVVVDFYSKYPAIAMLERMTTSCVILHMKSIFARHEIPSQLVSVNMPFASREVNDFAKEWGSS